PSGQILTRVRVRRGSTWRTPPTTPGVLTLINPTTSLTPHTGVLFGSSFQDNRGAHNIQKRGEKAHGQRPIDQRRGSRHDPRPTPFHRARDGPAQKHPRCPARGQARRAFPPFRRAPLDSCRIRSGTAFTKFTKVRQERGAPEAGRGFRTVPPRR